MLIDDYNLDIKTGDFPDILPYRKLEEKCEYCNKNLYRKRARKHQDSDYIEAECLTCNHKIYTRYWKDVRKCECRCCIQKRERIRKEKIKSIFEYYDSKPEKIDISLLKFEEQVILVDIIKNINNLDLEEILSVNELNIKYDLREDYLRKINILLKCKAISVSPYSSFEAFIEEDFPKNVDLIKAKFLINVIIDDEKLDLINDGTYFINDNFSVEEKIGLWKIYIYNDAIYRFKKLLEVRSLNLHVSEEANKKFIEIIDIISYTKLMTLCFNVSRFYSDKVVTGEMHKKQACNAALGSVWKFYENNIAKGWKINDSECNYCGNDLKFYVKEVLGKNIEILKEVPSIEALENAKDIERLGLRRVIDSVPDRIKRF